MDLTYVNSGILAVVGIFACGLIAAGVSVLHAKKSDIISRTQDTKFFTIVNIVANFVDDALATLGAEVIADIKAKSADGQITKQELDELVSTLKAEVGAIISENLKLDFIADYVDDWDKWLEAKIRAFVQQYLTGKNVTVKR
jgi:hypothetical protein